MLDACCQARHRLVRALEGGKLEVLVAVLEAQVVGLQVPAKPVMEAEGYGTGKACVSNAARDNCYWTPNSKHRSSGSSQTLEVEMGICFTKRACISCMEGPLPEKCAPRSSRSALPRQRPLHAAHATEQSLHNANCAHIPNACILQHGHTHLYLPPCMDLLMARLGALRTRL